MKSKLFSFIAIIFLLISCKDQTNTSFNSLDSKAFAEKLKTKKNPQLIDVRTPEEFEVEHIQNAKNINWKSDDFVQKIEKLDKSKPVFLYCKKGGRSNKAALKLIELGFKEIYDLDGGIMKWNPADTADIKGKTSEKI